MSTMSEEKPNRPLIACELCGSSIEEGEPHYKVPGIGPVCTDCHSQYAKIPRQEE